MFYTLLDRYAKPEMSKAIRTLREWHEKHGKDYAKIWIKERELGTPAAIAVDESRRLVSHFFQSAYVLYHKHFVTELFAKAMDHFTGLSIFLDTVEGLEAELNPKYDREAFGGFRVLFPDLPRKPIRKLPP